MAVTVGAGDFTQLHNMESSADQYADGSVFASLGQINQYVFVEGSYSTPFQAKNITVATKGWAGTWNSGNNWNISGKHLYIWVRSLDAFDTEANNGMAISVSDASDWSAYGDWTVGGQDTRRATVEGFIRLAIDTARTYDNSASPPALTSVDGVGLSPTMVGGSGQNTFFLDSIESGTYITITGGGSTTQGKSSEIAAIDETLRGVFKSISGIYYILGGLHFGDTATGSNYFFDAGEVWLFEDQNVSNTLYTVSFEGNATGVNSHVFGSLVGTGKTARGVGGNTFLARQAPFNIVCTDTDVDENKFYGCSFLNSSTAGGTIKLETADTEAITCLFSQCDEITVRNGALLRGATVITDSTASATEGALNLGGADPATDTVRDLQIQNCSKGIKLVGTGNVTYNFRNIKFANNTNDVRVDFGVGDTVTINILEGGDTPSIDNVNGSTVVINNAVTLRVEGVTEGAAVKVVADETVGTVTLGDVLLEALADSTGAAETTLNYEAAFDPSGLDVIARVRGQGLPSAAIQDDNGSYTDETTAANSAAAGDISLLPAAPVSGQDAYLFGHNEEFGRLKLILSQAGVGGGTITWQYWNGSTWASLSGVSDGTSNFSQLGENVVSWTTPVDWADTTVNGQGPFRFVRALFSAGSFTTPPKGSRCKLDVNRYLPFTQNRIITSDGLTVVATWVRDTIASF